MIQHLKYPVLTLTALLFALFVGAQPVKLEKVRDDFFGMKSSDNGALNLYFKLKPLDLSAYPVLMAYRGASSAASAGSVSGVNKKLQYFNKGREELEKAVKSKPGDVEIRFLRLATQLNAPAFLGYSGQVDADKKFIIQRLSMVGSNDPNAYFYARVADFLMDTEILSKQEIEQMSAISKKLKNKS